MTWNEMKEKIMKEKVEEKWKHNKTKSLSTIALMCQSYDELKFSLTIDSESKAIIIIH